MMNKIVTIYGKDIIGMTKKLLKEVNPTAELKKDTVFGIKPNLVCATPATEGATTHPQIVEGIIQYLLEEGFFNIKVLESAWVGDDTKRAYDVCGYNGLKEKYDIPLIDLKDDSYTEKEYKGLKIKICNEVFKTDYLINVPLIKGHCQTKITCALKNLKGLIPDSEKRRFHTLGLHKPIAVLNKLIHQNLIIADGICPDPYFEEGGQPREMNRIALGFDPVLMDMYAAGLLGYQKEDIPYIGLAEQEGVGTGLKKYELTEIERNQKTDISVKQITRKYLNIIDEADACSACYNNLIAALKKLDEKGLAEYFVDNICIGQGYKEYPGAIGVGDCTTACTKNLPGCPPSANEMITFLKQVIGQD